MTKHHKVLTLIFASLLNCLQFACTKKQNQPDDQDSTSVQHGKKVVNLAIWNNYLSPELQKKFTQQTGIELKISNYSSNEELLAKVQSGASGIDVAIPSDYMVNIMIKTHQLAELKQDLIQNKSGIEAKWLKQAYDLENKYSYPYAWSTTGIAYHKGLIKTPPKSWKDFYTLPEYSGKMSMLDDVREVIASALKLQQHSVNSHNPAELQQAEKVLLQQKSRIKMFRSDIIEALLNKEVAIAQAYSSDSLQAFTRTKGQIEFIIPEEGGTRAIDNLVIFKGAKHFREAHQLIDFMLSAEANLSFVLNVMGGPVLKTTREQLPIELKNSKTLFPNENQLQKLESLMDMGEATKMYDELWTKLKTE